MTGQQLGLEGLAVPPQGEDFVATPTEITERLLHFCPLPPGDVLEPFAGGGAILQVLLERGKLRSQLWALELRPEERPFLEDVSEHVAIGDFQELRAVGLRCPILITNPPFSRLPDAARWCFPDNLRFRIPYTALLMPIDELAGKQSTSRFLSRVGEPTDLVVIPYRPWGFDVRLIGRRLV